MQDAELESLLATLESDRAERKASLSDRDKVCEAICAFANDLPNHNKPGVVFIGANDDGSCARFPITDDLLLNIRGIRSEGNILPIPSMVVQKRTLRGCDMAVILVDPSHSPPVRYRGRVWIRVGPSRAIANPDEERRLNEKRRFRDIPADIRPMTSATLDVLDESLFQQTYLPSAVAADVLQQNQRTIGDQLVAAKFAHPGPPLTPTVLGVMTVGKSPTDWIPGAYIQFVRLDGTGLTDAVQSTRELRGSIPGVLSELDELLKVNIQTAVDFTSGSVEARKPDYPLVALQQITRNAVLHRSYENTNEPVRLYWFRDRVEVHNPGGPYGQVTRADFGRPGLCDYRNPNLAAVMKELGYVQRFGMGIPLTHQEMKKNGNPPPEFVVEDTRVLVVLRRMTP